jgi:lipopolysaccharide export system protein LptC
MSGMIADGQMTIAHGRSGGGGAGRTAEGFRAAAAHSGRVRFLRRAIPLGAGVAVAALLAVWIMDPFRPKGIEGLDVKSLGLSGTRVVMRAPSLTGFKKDNTPYEVTATSAFQDIRKPHVIELKEMKADLALDGGGRARLTAAEGVYDGQRETLDLSSDVRVVTDTGLEVKLDTAKVDLKAGTVASDRPVDVVMKNGTIAAERLDILDNGKKIVFSGRVRAVLDGASSEAPAGPARTAEGTGR